MNVIELFDSTPFLQALGRMLVHFVWQGALLAGLIWMALNMMRRASANARYIVCCGGMLVMLLCPIVTLAVILRSSTGIDEDLALLMPLLELDSTPLWHYIAPALPWLTLCWLAGIVVLQGKLILNWSHAQRMKRTGIRWAPVECRRLVQELLDVLQIRTRVKVFESTMAKVPMVMGWLQPVILIPGYALTGLTPQQLKAVLAHELAHVRRNDYLINLIQAIFESMFFYHPAVWWISNRLRTEREYCCDDVAVSVCRDALSYAKALSSLDTLRDDERRTVLATTGGPLMNRIFRILGVPSSSSYRIGGWLAPLMIALCLTTAAVAFTATDMDSASDNAKLLAADKAATPGHDGPSKDELKKKAEAIAKKMEAAGKSEKEIKIALNKFWKEAQAKSELSDKEIAFKKKVDKVLSKMKAEGKSKKEIMATLEKMEKEFQLSQMSKEEQWLKQKEEDLVKTMKAKGHTKIEIQKAVQAMYDKAGIKPATKKSMIIVDDGSDTDALIKKLKKKGLSDKEIKKILHEKKAQEEKKKSAAK